ncbi:TetR/AcrR family transcriptional regulator [Pseudomonas lini]
MNMRSANLLVSVTRQPGDRILEAAYDLMIEQGFTAMSMRSLAKKVGLHAGSLYYHFPSKQELLEEVIESLQQRRLKAWYLEKAGTRDTLAQLTAFIRFNVRRHLHCLREERLLKLETCHLAPEQRLRVDEQEACYVQELKGILQRGVKERLFLIDDLNAVAYGILGLCSCTPGLSQECVAPEACLVDTVTRMTHQLLSLKPRKS